MNDFWKNLVSYDEKIQQNNINKEVNTSEALVDALNDDPSTIPDEINDENQTENTNDNTTNSPEQEGEDTNLDSSSDDFNMDANTTDAENDTLEPEKVEKDKYSLLNGKIEIVKQFENLIAYAESAKDMLETNVSLHKEKIHDLEKLIEMMEEIKSKIAIKTQAESLVRYRMCYIRLKNILNECTISSDKNKPNNND